MTDQADTKLTEEYALSVLDAHLSAIAELRRDARTQEVMINRYDDIWVERGGQLLKTDLVIPAASLSIAINMLANVNRKNHTPLLDARLPGLRIAAAKYPVAVHGDMMSIRMHSRTRLTVDDYERIGAFSPVVDTRRAHRANDALLDRLSEGGRQLTDFFRWAMKARHNIALSGGTSSGKTTLLNAITYEIPESDRLVTIEDTAELQVTAPNHIALETNSGVTIRDLVRFSLRIRPDRIIIGECRGAEAMDMMNALNTGHSGSAFSCHSNTGEYATTRLETLIRESDEGQLLSIEDLRERIASTFRFFVHAERVGDFRGPVEVREILGVENARYKTRTLFKRFIQPEDFQNVHASHAAA